MGRQVLRTHVGHLRGPSVFMKSTVPLSLEESENTHALLWLGKQGSDLLGGVRGVSRVAPRSVPRLAVRLF